jgi:hypothetical protein
VVDDRRAGGHQGAQRHPAERPDIGRQLTQVEVAGREQDIDVHCGQIGEDSAQDIGSAESRQHAAQREADAWARRRFEDPGRHDTAFVVGHVLHQPLGVRGDAAHAWRPDVDRRHRMRARETEVFQVRGDVAAGGHSVLVQTSPAEPDALLDQGYVQAGRDQRPGALFQRGQDDIRAERRGDGQQAVDHLLAEPAEPARLCLGLRLRTGHGGHELGPQVTVRQWIDHRQAGTRCRAGTGPVVEHQHLVTGGAERPGQRHGRQEQPGSGHGGEQEAHGSP